MDLVIYHLYHTTMRFIAWRDVVSADVATLRRRADKKVHQQIYFSKDKEKTGYLLIISLSYMLLC